MTAVADRPVRQLLSHQVRWVAVLTVGSALYAAVLAALLGTGDILYVPSLLLLGSAIVPVTFVTLVGLQGRGLSVAQVAASAALGGVLAIVVAGSLEYAAAGELGSLPTWIVGLIEETAKLAVPAVILLWRKPSPLDGVILGVAVGGCFAMLETMGYAFVGLLQSGGNLEGVTGLLAARSVFEPGGHAAWTGLAPPPCSRSAAAGGGGLAGCASSRSSPASSGCTPPGTAWTPNGPTSSSARSASAC